MPKKKFIDKKNSVTYELVHRDQKDPNISDTSLPPLVLRPVKAYGKPVDPDMYEMLLRKYQPEFAVSGNNPEAEKEEFDSDDEEHIFKRFTRPMGTGQGVFITPKGEILNAPPSVNIQNIPTELLPSHEEDEVGLLSKGLDDDIDEEIEEALEYFDEGQYEELGDDFVSELVEISQKEEAEELENEMADESYGEMDGIEQDNLTVPKLSSFADHPKGLGRGPNHPKTDIDEAFDVAMEQFESDENSSDDEAVDRAAGTEDIKSFDYALDQFLQGQAKIPYKHEAALCHVWEPKKPYDPSERITTIPKADQQVLQFAQQQKDDYDEMEEDEKLEEIRVMKKEVEWDCQSVLTTYTNTDNHPSLIAEPRKELKIAMTKDGVPKWEGLKRRQEEEEEEDEDGAPKENFGVSRPKDESPLVKKARKQAAKEQKKVARERKKLNREMFREEETKQRNENLGNLKHTTVIQYGVH